MKFLVWVVPKAGPQNFENLTPGPEFRMSSSSVGSVKTPEQARTKHDKEEAQLEERVQEQAQQRQHHEQEGQQGEWAIDIDKVKTDFEKALKTNDSSTSPAAQDYHEDQRKFLDELLESERKTSSTCSEVNGGDGVNTMEFRACKHLNSRWLIAPSMTDEC